MLLFRGVLLSAASPQPELHTSEFAGFFIGVSAREEQTLLKLCVPTAECGI